jgi:peptidoglycan/LPS O-acetylase OafA/YrhL
MKRLTLRTALEVGGTALVVIGMLLIAGSVAVWQFGPEMLTRLYESVKPVVPFFLAGVGLLVLGLILALNIRPTNPSMCGLTPSASKENLASRCSAKARK